MSHINYIKDSKWKNSKNCNILKADTFLKRNLFFSASIIIVQINYIAESQQPYSTQRFFPCSPYPDLIIPTLPFILPIWITDTRGNEFKMIENQDKEKFTI